ncbi:MAG: 50S ribosomal protein L6 [Endomicrobium sp.]|jgi:large subunit ribosomal protein L6|nr:50S ribosomal protein L6 [Endomicrobium sp.]
MSRLSKQPIMIMKNIVIDFTGGILSVKSSKGKLQQEIHKDINLEIRDNFILLKVNKESRKINMLCGMLRGMILNMLEGVSRGFEKQLEVIGLGYKVNIDNPNRKIILFVGFSHSVSIDIPIDLNVNTAVTINKTILIKINGISKCKVGTFAAKIRDIKPPEPYKGFGIRYLNEKVIRKSGKSTVSSSNKSK